MSEPTRSPQHELATREKELVEREGMRPGPVFRPDVDIAENGDHVYVTADLPGVADRDVQVRLEDGVLSIDATPSAEAPESWTPLHQEYRTGGYHREFRISDKIDADKISATMRDGVLELSLPKAERHRPRTIEVRSS